MRSKLGVLHRLVKSGRKSSCWLTHFFYMSVKLHHFLHDNLPAAASESATVRMATAQGLHSNLRGSNLRHSTNLAASLPSHMVKKPATVAPIIPLGLQQSFAAQLFTPRMQVGASFTVLSSLAFRGVSVMPTALVFAFRLSHLSVFELKDEALKQWCSAESCLNTKHMRRVVLLPGVRCGCCPPALGWNRCCQMRYVWGNVALR